MFELVQKKQDNLKFSPKETRLLEIPYIDMVTYVKSQGWDNSPEDMVRH